MSQRIIEDKEYDLQFSTIGDEPALKKWILDEETRLWYPPSSDADVESFVRNWIGFSRHKSSLTAVYKGESVGIATIFLMPYKKVAHLCMMYMVVAPEFQRKGVGTSLLRNIKHLAKTRFRLESMHCEVFDGCPIIGLLEEGGFEQIIHQDHFVKLPDGFRGRIILETKL